MNEFLLDHGLLHPSLVSSLKLPSLSLRLPPFPHSENSSIPVWTGTAGLLQGRKGENKDRSWVTKEKKKTGSVWGTYLKRADRKGVWCKRVYWGLESSDLLLGCSSNVLETVAILVLQSRSGLGWMPSCCKRNWWSGSCAHEWERPGRR